MEKLYKSITKFLSKHSYNHGFGQYVESNMLAMTNDTLPMRTPLTVVRMNAHLSTNESIDDSFVITDALANPLDGYIIGVGFGHVFKMIDLFSDDTLPLAIICADVQPEVILVGR